MKRRLFIFDVTLREGEQAPGCTMLPHEKVAVAEMLEKLNVDVIEAGFAASSPGDMMAIRAVAARVKNAIVSSLCRAREGDIDAAAEALREAAQGRIHILFATSDLHLKYKFNITRPQALEQISSAIRYASKRCSDVQFTAEDAGRTDRAFLLKVIDTAVKAGATTINMADTVGYLIPEEFADLIRFIREKLTRIDHVRFSVHVHDDLGLALASTLAAIQAGVDQVECTINGIGDRAGICALEEIVHALKIRQDHFFSVYTGIEEKYLVETSQLVAQYTGTRVPYFKPVVGSRARKGLALV